MTIMRTIVLTALAGCGSSHTASPPPSAPASVPVLSADDGEILDTHAAPEPDTSSDSDDDDDDDSSSSEPGDDSSVDVEMEGEDLGGEDLGQDLGGDEDDFGSPD